MVTGLLIGSCSDIWVILYLSKYFNFYFTSAGLILLLILILLYEKFLILF